MKIFMLVLSWILFSLTSNARWLERNEANYEMLDNKYNLDIAADGSYTFVDETTYKILNEKGRLKFALESVPYSSSSQKVKILSASSATDGVITPVDVKDLKRRAAGGKAEGFDDSMEVLIPFSNIKIGSTVTYKISLSSKYSVLPGFFSMRFVYGALFYEKKGLVTIRSPQKIYFSILDDDSALKVTETKDKGQFVLKIEQVKPAFKVTDEASPQLAKRTYSQVEVSTNNQWQSFATPLAKRYDEIINLKELPTSFKLIADKTKAIKTLTEKIDFVTSQLAELMTYSGDWSSRDRKFFARSLAEIEKKKTGDCKDFSAATTAILRSIGIQADVALVHRRGRDRSFDEISRVPIDQKLVQSGLFNHAIVHVNDQGKSIWVDPTNFVSNSSMIYEDIAKSPALVLRGDTNALKSIPEASIGESQLKIVKNITINADDTLDTKGTMELSGEYMKSIHELALTQNVDVAKQITIKLFGSVAEKNRFVVEGINFKKRIAKNSVAKIRTRSEEKYISEKENKKYLMVPVAFRLNSFLSAGQNRVSDFYVGSPSSEESVYTVDGFDFVGTEVGCTVLTPWFSAERQLFKTSKGFQVKDTFKFKSTSISAKEVNSAQYAMDAGDIYSCANAQYIEIKEIEPKLTLEKRLVGYNYEAAKKLATARAAESIDKSRQAKHMIEQILEQNPKHPLSKDLRLLLYRAFTRIGYKRNDIDMSAYLARAGNVIDALYAEHPKDPEVLQKKTYFAIEKKDLDEMKKFFALAYTVSPKEYDIFRLGGDVSEELKKYDLAEKSFLKAASLAKNPVDLEIAYSSLASVNEELLKYDRAVEYYDLAIKQEGKNAWLFSHYVSLLVYLKKWDRAIEVAEQMLKISDFGVGRRLLATAYASKALSLSSDPKNDEQVTGLCMKALKNKKDESLCLITLGRKALARARKNKDLQDAEKSLDYFQRALADEKLTNEPRLRKEIEKTETIIAKMRRGEARAPASEP